MDITLAAERLFLLEERLTLDEIQQRAMDRRTQAVGSLLQRPKPEEVMLLNKQRRLEPFWHVAGRAVYVYERKRDYQVPASAADVEALTINGTRYEADSAGKRIFTVPAREHCRAVFAHQLFVDGLTGAPLASGETLVNGPRSEISDPAAMVADETVVLPPEHRASYVVRQLMGEIMKPVPFGCRARRGAGPPTPCRRDDGDAGKPGGRFRRAASPFPASLRQGATARARAACRPGCPARIDAGNQHDNCWRR